MKNQIKIFKNDVFGEIRTCLVNNQIMFVGKDVAQALGYSNPLKAIRDHVDNEDKLGEQIVHSGQRRTAIVINESGLYSLILSSKLPQAKDFKRWVTSEVLPQIRMTGGRWRLNEDLLGRGLVAERIFLCYSLKGKPRMRRYMVWTPEGGEFLNTMVRKMPREITANVQLNLMFNA